MERCRMVFSGSGGHGVITAAIILAEAAVLYENLTSVQSQTYGPEARGGACAAEVVVSDTSVDYPVVGTPDVAVIMSQEAYGTYGRDIQPGGTLILDEDLVEHEPRTDVRLLLVPATRIAEGLGRKIVANVVVLGALAAAVSTLSKDALLKAVLAAVPPHTRDLNQKAFEAGYAYVKEHHREP